MDEGSAEKACEDLREASGNLRFQELSGAREWLPRSQSHRRNERWKRKEVAGYGRPFVFGFWWQPVLVLVVTLPARGWAVAKHG